MGDSVENRPSLTNPENRSDRESRRAFSSKNVVASPVELVQARGTRQEPRRATSVAFARSLPTTRMHASARIILTSAWLELLPALLAGECTVEGKVQFPGVSAIAGAGGAAGRYPGMAPGKVGAPARPVAVIYLEGAPATNPPDPPPVARLEQRQFQFTPIVLPVLKGTQVEFPNHDDEYHNVLSYSKTKEFDLGRYLKSEKAPTVLFEKPGVVEVNCEIHEHMRAFILVLDTPFFTTTAVDGTFHLDHLPPGRYTLKAWLGPKVNWSQPVELTEAATKQAQFPP